MSSSPADDLPNPPKHRTKPQVQHELNRIAKMIGQSKMDGEIIDELRIPERTFYYYKHKLYQRSADIQAKKTEKSLFFAQSLLGDRLTR
jgi:hypothetical protein